MACDIKQWRDSVLMEEETAPDRPYTPILRLFTTASSLYGLLLECVEGLLPTPDIRRLERERDRLRLWADGYGVVSGNLDRVLADTRRMRHSTICLLVSICRTLVKGALKRVPEDSKSPDLKKVAIEAAALADSALHTYCVEDDADESDSESDNELDGKPDADSPRPDRGSFKDITEDFKTDIQCLIDLGPTYDEPARNKGVQTRTAEATETITSDPASYFTDRLHHHFPNANTKLVSLLGKTNWERFKRLSRSFQENTRSFQENTSSEERQVAQRDGTGYITGKDSGIGTSISASSIPAATTYAETVFSYHGGSTGTSIRVPPIPREEDKGSPLFCPLCGDSVSVKDKAAWKRHIMADLQPYACIVISCDKSQIPFPNKKIWVDHLQLEHRFFDSSSEDDGPVCTLCQKPVFGGVTLMVSHLAQHLEEASLTILPANAESSDDGSSAGDDSSSTSIIDGELRRRERADSKASDATLPHHLPSPNSDKKADRRTFPGPHLSRGSAQPLASLTTQPSGPLGINPSSFQFTPENSGSDDGLVPATTVNMLPVQSPRFTLSKGGRDGAIVPNPLNTNQHRSTLDGLHDNKSSFPVPGDISNTIPTDSEPLNAAKNSGSLFYFSKYPMGNASDSNLVERGDANDTPDDSRSGMEASPSLVWPVVPIPVTGGNLDQIFGRSDASPRQQQPPYDQNYENIVMEPNFAGYHSCLQCGRSYARACDLRKHQKNHQRPNKCPLCDKGFAENKDLDRHLWIHHPMDAKQRQTLGGRALCPHAPCQYVGRRDNLKRHIQQVHG